MFGLAGRTALSSGSKPAPATPSPCCGPTPRKPASRKGSIADGADARGSARIPPNCCARRAGTGIDARASRDAGSYLCNYLSWRAIEAVDTDDGPRLAAFIHIPPLARGGASRRKGCSRHHAGRAGRCRRGDADGDGEAGATGGVKSGFRTGRAKRSPIILARIAPMRFRCVCPSLRIVLYATLTLPRTIAAFSLASSPCPAAFSRYLWGANARRALREDHSPWTSTAAISWVLPPPVSPARWRCRPMPRARRPSPPRSAATPRNMACAPAAPTIRPKPCNARSTRPRARKCRWRCRRASIAPACFACKAARNWSACAARPNSSSTAAPRCCRAKAPAASACRASRSTAAASPLPQRRGLVHCLGGRDIRITDCEITGQRRQRHLAGAGLRRHQRQHLHEDRDHRGGVVRCAGPDRVAQHHHRTPTTTASRSCAPRSATTARWCSTTASRTSRPAPAAPASMATPSTPSAPAM